MYLKLPLFHFRPVTLTLLMFIGSLILTGQQARSQTVVDVASGSEDFSILVEAVVKAELVGALSAPGPFTVFAPTNKAFRELFKAIGVDGVDDLSKEQLTPILLYHVVNDEILSSRLNDGQKFNTLFGNEITVGRKADVLKINESKVILNDIFASNGLIHAIDQVLIPAGNVVSYTLVNAETDEDIMDINDGDTLNIAMIGTNQLNIRANIDPEMTGSVKFALNGEELRIENLFPYAAFSDNDGDYLVWEPELIDYTLATTPFSQANAGGVQGPTDTLSFTVVNRANIVQLAIQNPDLSILVEAVVKAGLVDALSADGPLTVFAPTNDAFNKLFSALGVRGIQDLTSEQLTPILLYHVINANVLSTDLNDGDTAGTLFGNDVTVTKQGDLLKINDSEVILADVMATNGTVHVIDHVLIPAGNVVSYTLVNAETDEDIMDINQGDTLDIAMIGTNQLNIRANINPEMTGSVKFALNGEELRIENLFPYAVFSDKDGDYLVWEPELIDYTLATTPFSQANAGGVQGPTDTLSFTVVNRANIVQLAIQNPNLSILVEAVVKAGLVDALSADGPLTVFAPTNDAFNKLFSALGVRGIQDLTSEQLTPILLYHVINANVLSTDLNDGDTAGTLFGNDVTVTKQGDLLKINDSEVILADVMATNGTVHVIDHVLIPAGNVVSYTLVNAETDEDIMDINEGDTINIAMIGTNQLNIRANINPEMTGSVKFALNGEELRIENLFPYAAFSDKGGDYLVWEPELIDYTLATTPFSQANASGVQGPTDTLSFTVVDTPNIVQLAQRTPDLSILVEAVIKADLVGALSGEGPLTVFAPTNDAFNDLFEVLGIDGIEDLTQEELTPILLYHVLNGQVLSTDLNAGQIVPTLNGGGAVVLSDDSGVTVNGNNVILPDLLASNGVVHVIDQVLLPNNIVQVAQGNPDFSILVEAVIKAGLVDALSGPGPLTVFAPTNQAFEVLFEDLDVDGIEDLTAEQLTPILLYHVVGQGLLSTDLNDGDTAPTLETSEVLVSVDAEGRISINNSEVLIPNVAASNGVIHAINRVLLPPSDGTGDDSTTSREFEVNAYPNPVTNVLTINPLQDQSSNTTNVVIYHTKGKIYYQGQMNSENNGQLNVNVANYPTGIYLIKLRSGSQEETIRIYKK